MLTTMIISTGWYSVHDVGFVNSCHSLSAVFSGVVKCKLGYTPRLFRSDNFQALDHTLHTLMFERAVTADTRIVASSLTFCEMI